MRKTPSYAIRQLVWMLTSAMQLVYALSTGVLWVMQMARLFLYGACVGACFIPHWWWYLTSPNIIRRVSYRSSETTKRQNMLRVLEGEGADLREVLRTDSVRAVAVRRPRRRPPPPFASTVEPNCAARRRGRWVPAASHTEAAFREGDEHLSPPSQWLPPDGSHPFSSYREGDGKSAVCEAARSEEGRVSHGTIDGEVNDRALSVILRVSPGAPLPSGESFSYCHGQSTAHGGVSIPSEPLDGTLTSLLSGYASPPIRHYHPSPSRHQASVDALRGGGGAAAAGTAPALTTLGQPRGTTIVRESTCLDSTAVLAISDNPGDMRRCSGPSSHAPTLRKNTTGWVTDPTGSVTTGAQTGSCSASSGGTTTPSTGWTDGAAGPHDLLSHTISAVTTPSFAPATGAARINGAPLHALRRPANESTVKEHAVFYEALPSVDPSLDPLLHDVLTALHEGDSSGMTAGPLQSGRQSSAQVRRRPAPSQRLRRCGGASAPQRHRAVPPDPSAGPERRTAPVSVVAGHVEGGLAVDEEEDDEEDRMNLHNRATVDIVLPVPLDSLMKTLDYAKQRTRLRRKRFPIVIDVIGAVWIIGSHLWSTMMARVLAQRGYVVFCPDYRNFPQTTMEGMTLDVSDAIAWVLNNAERYNGDLDNVTVIGQSAGAHLTMMSILSQAQLSAYRYNSERGLHEDVPPPSDVAYNVPRYHPRASIHRYIGLSGMYHIEGLVEHFHRKGLNTPVLYQIAGGKANMARYSIHAYLDDRRGGDTGEVLPDNIFDFFPRRMFFIHGDADASAPVSESASLVGMLRAAQERYTQRRSVRSEEVRRHALRSRRQFASTMVAEARPVSKLGEVQSGTTRTQVFSQRSVTQCGGEELAASANTGLNGGTRGEWPPDDAPHPDPVGKLLPQRMGAAATTTTTPLNTIIPTPREDTLQPPVELAFLLIPGGCHSDAFVDECIAAGRSCCVDFLCDYESILDFQCNTAATASTGASEASVYAEGFAGAASSWISSAAPQDRSSSWSTHTPDMCVAPDAFLPLAVPCEDRSLPLRLCKLVCPF